MAHSFHGRCPRTPSLPLLPACLACPFGQECTYKCNGHNRPTNASAPAAEAAAAVCTTATYATHATHATFIGMPRLPGLPASPGETEFLPDATTTTTPATSTRPAGKQSGQSKPGSL